jgi:signal transduction histidine kinase
MNAWLIIALSFAYLAVLFLVAQWAENRDILHWKKTGAFVYALSIAVYCSAWTFYGSIGRAATSGIDFLAIYMGPILVFPVWWLLAKKIIRIVKAQHISSLADFMASRYGKNQSIGTLVSILSIIAITPYIALQIKAIGDSFSVITNAEKAAWINPVLVTTIAICAFTLVYGTKFLSGNKPKTGMVTAVALESIVKLVAFLVGGFVLINLIFGGSSKVFADAAARPELQHLFTLNGPNAGSDWFWLMLLSGIAILLLPRQFQVAIIENRDEKHLNKAMWMVPLYLLLINLFVLPIALAGRLYLGGAGDSDYIFLNLANLYGSPWLTALIYFGGFSAATSMIIVSSLSLGNMLSTNVILPNFIRPEKNRDYSNKIIIIRRLSLIVIFVLGYGYYYFLAYNVPLVSIGVTSFAGIAQLAPAFFGGLFWRGASRKGAMGGIITGFAIWFYGLILPTLLSNFGLAPDFMEHGIFGIKSLSPLYFGAAIGLSHLSAVAAFSLFANLAVFATVSVLSTPSKLESNQAELFVNIMRISARNFDQAGIWQANVPFHDIKSLLINFLGDSRTEEVLDRYARINRINFAEQQQADPRMISYAERLLTEAIGPASARIMIASVAKGEEISIYEVLDILRESKEVMQLNRDLRQKTEELERATQNLKLANDRLKEFSLIKDEFLYTVTHELRTPLTAIRTQAELLQDDDEMPVEDRQRFLDSMVRECERLTKLITNVLDLEKFESGSQKLSLANEDPKELITEAVESLRQLAAHKGIELQLEINSSLAPVLLDRERIHQVLVNLLSNAIKFSPPKTGKIVVTAYHLDDNLKVNVVDNGPGISHDEAELVFDKFYQVKNQTRKKPTGSGLGLAICKNIINMHQGNIWVEAEPGSGTRFSFTLPLKRKIVTPETTTT